jgi:uncharacterized protein YkwD
MKAFTFLAAVLPGFIFFMFSSCHRKTVPVKSSSTNKTYSNTQVDVSTMENNILFYVNRHRRAIGLPDLQMLTVASAEAARHSANMAAKRTPFGHAGFESRVSAISRSLGSVSAAAENVADGKLTAQEVVDGWLHSPAHKKNIEGNYTLTGIGLATDAGGIMYFTQIFVHK